MSAPSGALPALGLLTINVHGLGDRVKCAAIFGRATSYNIVMMQETHCTNAQFTQRAQQGQGPGRPWDGRQYHAAGDERSRGVAILLRPSLLLTELPDKPFHASADGRLLRVDVVYNGQPLSLISVYAPTLLKDRASFFSQRLANLLPPHACIVAGDFNCILHWRDAPLGTGEGRYCGANELEDVQDSHGLVDSFRHLHPHPDDNDFTHRSASSGTVARLDRVLISSCLLPDLTTAGIDRNIPSDHNGATIRLEPPGGVPRGPGPWRADPSLLNDSVAEAAIRDAIITFQQENPLSTQLPIRDWWEACKVHLQVVIRAQALRALRERSAEPNKLQQAELRAHAALMAAVAQSRPPAQQQLLLSRWRDAELAVHRCSLQRAAKEWSALSALNTTYGESSTYFFHRSGRPPHQPTVIPAICDPLIQGRSIDLSTPEGRAAGSRAAFHHFSGTSPVGLFRAPDVSGANAGHKAECTKKLLSALDRRLSADEAGELEDPLTEAELLRAARHCPRGSVPGSDGIPYEFYLRFWDLLGPVLEAVAQAAYDDVDSSQPYPSSMVTGMICLLYKGNGLPRDQLSSYRPITLLNCDIKIISRAVADRLQSPLDGLIDVTQTAYLKGRWIAENTMYHLCLAEHLQATAQPGCLVILDIKQAYDMCDREYVGEVMPAMGFGPNMCRMVRHLSCGTRACCLINGWRTEMFPVHNGLPQGSPLAPLLWVLQYQPLSALLRNLVSTGMLRTPRMPSGAFSPPSHKHADDTKLVVQDLHRDLPVAMGAVDTYCVASNAQLNRTKSKGVTMGSHTPVLGTDPITGITFAPADDPPKLLGLAFTTDLTVAAERNFVARKKGLLAVKFAWLRHALTFYGRAHVVKQVMASGFLYHWSVQPPTAEQLAYVDRIIQDFLLKTPHPSDGTCRTLHPRLTFAALPWADGGMSLSDLPVLLRCMQAKFIALAFSPGVQPWKELVRHALAAAAPLGAGADFVVRRVPCAAPAALLPRMQAMAESFRKTEPHRTLPAEALPHAAIMREPLYFNPWAGERGMEAGDIALWAELLPHGGVPRVQDLRNALLELQHQPPQPTLLQPPRPSPTLAAVQEIIRCLPQAWQAAVEMEAPPAPDWLVHSLVPWLVTVNFYVNDPEEGSGYYAARENGRMVPISEEAALGAMAKHDGGTWLPACILTCAKPQHLWTKEDHRLVDISTGSSQGEPYIPQEPRLLGPWETLSLWPAAWAHGSKPLHEFCVKTARVRCFQMRATDADPNYKVGRGLCPTIWEPGEAEDSSSAAAAAGTSSSRSQSQEADPDTGNSGQGRTSIGLQALEKRWEADVRGRSLPSRPPSSQYAGPEVDSPAMRKSQPREHPLKRAAERRLEEAAAAAEAEERASQLRRRTALQVWLPSPSDTDRAAANPAQPSDFKQAWSRIRDSSMPKGQRGIAFRVMHGALACNAFVAFRRRNDARLHSACCQAPQCLAANQMEHLSHLFIGCPSVRPALDWLLSTWHAVSGVQLPAHPSVILADDPAAWPAGNKPPPAHHALWNRLRIAYLYYTWIARCSLQTDSPDQHAASIATAIVRNITDQIRGDWLRVTSDIRYSTSVCSSWFRGRDPAMEMEAFEGQWALNGVLCQCSGGSLDVKFTVAAPVPIPPATPVEVEGQ